MNTKRFICSALNTALCASTLALFGCNQQTPTSAAPAAPATAAAPAPAATPPAAAGTTAAAPSAPAYTPPSADQLYQMVAPIALFPDNLVAQVLAGATYPDQITAADNLLAQNPNLKGNLLQTAVNPQPWDASVKGLTAFPSVLDQMAKNIEWTTALGTAYVNDPTDVMNAIQVMRQRASQHGTLKSTAQQHVSTQAVAATTTTASYVESSPDYPPTYAGPAVVPAPEQVIEIQPAQPDVVYVPAYNPETVYGEPVAYYPGYTYARPAYSTGDVVVAGAIGFGAGILIANLFDHHDNHSWGWHSWGMHWGGGPGPGYGGGGGGWQRPAVVHNNNVYVSNSNTVINRYTTNNIVNNRYVNNGQITNNNGQINNNRFVNNGQINHGPGAVNNRPMPGNLPANGANFHPPGLGGITPQARAAAAAAPHGPMSVPDFRHATAPGQQPFAHGAAPNAMQANRPGPAAAGHPQAAAFVAQHAAPAAHPGQPAPAFNREAIAHPPAVNQHGGAPHPQPFTPAQAAPHPAEANHPAAPRPQQEFNRPAPRPQEFNHPAPAPRPQESNRPAPRQEEFNRPAPRPQPQERPQQHEAPHPAPAQHHSEPAKHDKDHDKH